MFERLRAGGGTLTFHNLLHFAYADVIFWGRLALHCLSASFAMLLRSFSLSNRHSGGRASKRASVGSLSMSAMSILTPVRAPSLSTAISESSGISGRGAELVSASISRRAGILAVWGCVLRPGKGDVGEDARKWRS